MSKALDSAYEKGREAAKTQEPRSACPYRDTRTNKGAVTWSRAFMRAWLDGWDDGMAEFGGT